mgnify:CR=1 FL=1
MNTPWRLIQNTQDEIKNIDKPLSAYQYYTKHFLEQWNNISEDDKDAYYIKAKLDKERYEKEKNDIMEKEAAELARAEELLSQKEDALKAEEERVQRDIERARAAKEELDKRTAEYESGERD